MNSKDSFTGNALRGSVITGSSQALKLLIQFASVPLLARLLLPDDFGLIASIAPVIGFISIFQSLGLSQAIVQRKDISDKQLAQIFHATFILGLLCALGVVVVSPGVAWFYSDKRLVLVTAAAALPVLMGALCSVPSGLLNRRLQFGKLALIDLGAAVAAFVAAALGALVGLGYWALVLSAFVSGLFSLAANWLAAGWRPTFRSASGLEKELKSFGANVTGFYIVYFFWRNLDVVLIAHQAGPHQLGLYDRAYKLLLFPLQNINGPVSRVMVPLLSRLQNEPERFRRAYLKALGQMLLVAVPGVAAMAAVPHELTLALFGPRWVDVAPIFGGLALAGLVEPLANTSGWLFVALDRTRIWFYWGLYAASTVIVGMLLGLRYGATGVAAAYAIGHYCVRHPILYLLIGHISPIKARDLAALQFPLLTAAALSWLTTEQLLRKQFGLSNLGLIFAALISSYTCAILVCGLTPPGREVLGDTIGLFSRALAWVRQARPRTT